MKRLIAIILVFVIVIPASVISEEQDQIVGMWYLYADMKKYPELSASYEDIDSELLIYYFLQSGTIMALMLNTKEGQGVPQYSVTGKWEKGNDSYSLSIIGGGTGKAYIKGNEMIAQILGGEGSYALLREMEEFNPYQDIYRK